MKSLSELAEPQRLIPLLLKVNHLDLSPETVGIYLQAILKAFGVWAAELSLKWEDDDLQEVTSMVEDIIEALKNFASSPDIEVQERVWHFQTRFPFAF
jgi:AP-3 complex subunit delta